MRAFMVVALLAQVVVPGPGVGQPSHTYVPKHQPGKTEAHLGALIAENAEQLPKNEWLQLSAVLRQLDVGRGRSAYEVDYLSISTGGKTMAESMVKEIKIDHCPEARAEAIERVREAWAPRAGGSILGPTGGWAIPVWHHIGPCQAECLSVTTTNSQWWTPNDPTSAACYRCLADAKDARDKAAKEQAEREARARAALDAVDAACAEKP